MNSLFSSNFIQTPQFEYILPIISYTHDIITPVVNDTQIIGDNLFSDIIPLIKSENDKTQQFLLREEANAFELNRIKHKSYTEEGKFRLDNARMIQYKRWEWYQENSELFSLILQNAGFNKEDIDLSMKHIKPLGMVSDFYDEFQTLVANSTDIIAKRMSNEYPDLDFGKLRIVLQGSYTVGYSSNPRKGDRYIPNYLFKPDKNSDYDFRCFSPGLSKYIELLRQKGIEILDRGSTGTAYIIKPKSINVIFPEFDDLIKDFRHLSKKYNDGNEIDLQITVYSENIGFEPNPWDYEL